MAVQRFGKDACGRRFTAAARTGKKEGMSHSAALQRVEQSAGDMLLTYDIAKILGAPFAGQYLILHREKGRAPGDLRHI